MKCEIRKIVYSLTLHLVLLVLIFYHPVTALNDDAAPDVTPIEITDSNISHAMNHNFATQSINDGHTKLGNTIDHSLNNYQQKISNHLATYIKVILEDEPKFKANIYISLSKSGEIITFKVFTSSIQQHVIDSLIRAVEASNPMPPPPKNLMKSSDLINFVVPILK